MMRVYEKLANSIILQVVKDYRKILKNLKKHPNKEGILSKKQEIEKFFRSDWFSILTNIEPEYFIIKLQNESFKNN